MQIDDSPAAINFDSKPSQPIDPLYLGLDDKEVARVCRENIQDSIAHYTAKGLYAKQDRNLMYYQGEQPLYKASTKANGHKENIIHEGISRQKPIMLSRQPDVMVKPGNDTPESEKCAKKLSGILNSDAKKRSNRKLLGLASKHEPIFYYAPVKARWNPEKGPFGDFEFINVHPKNVVWDQHCPTSDVDDMLFFAEKASLTLKEVIMMFPNKEKEIKEEFGFLTTRGSDNSKMATRIEIWEIWFHWYDVVEGQTAKIDGVQWLYGSTPLKQMKNPYYDYQGKQKTFSMVMEEKNAYSIDELFEMMDSNKEDTQVEKIYNNYFEEPRKPYFMMVYENMGEDPISATSRIEQMIEFQNNLNISGSIITDMNIRSRGKDLFDTNAIDQTTINNIDLYNVDEAIGLDVPEGSSINNSHSRIEQKPATQQQYKSMQDERQKGFEILGVGPSNRGLSSPESTLGQEQMGREGDFNYIDDIVEDTINAYAEWRGGWSLQFIKLFYTKPHMRHILGKDGEVLHTKITQDMVDDGMEVIVSASGVDKLQRKRMAIENAKLKMSDPLSFFEDTEQSNPKERAKRTMMFQMAPQMYNQMYLSDDLEPDNPAMPGMPPMPGAVPPEGPPPPIPPAQ